MRWIITCLFGLVLLISSGLGQGHNSAFKKSAAPFSALKPTAKFKIARNADWVEITRDSVWTAGAGPDVLVRVDLRTNNVVARIPLPGEACSGLAAGFGSIWVPVCAKKPLLVRVDEKTNRIAAVLPAGPAGEEQGIAASTDSIWIVTGNGLLSRIDPRTNKVRQEVAIPHGSWVPVYSNGVVWISGTEAGGLIAVDASSGEVLAKIPVGPNPRFLSAGAGSIWVLNQGDGSISRVHETSRKLVATIPANIPGRGGDICSGNGITWATLFGVPLTAVDPATNRVIKQWTGPGGDSLRCDSDSIWITDYRRGTLARILYPKLHKP